MKGPQNGCLFVLSIINALVFIGLLVISYFAGDSSNSGGLFIQDIGNVSLIYDIEINPANATFAIWGVIYLWQLVWIIYSIAATCRTTPDGPAYTTPVLLPVGFFILYILSLLTKITWLFLWDREYIIPACVVLFLTSVTLYICIGISYQFLYRNLMYLFEHGRKSDVYWVQFAVQNGLAMYAAWVTVATVLNLGSVLVYKLESPLQNSTASTVCLSILSVEIVLFVTLDLSVLDRYSRYIFMPYVVLVVALVGSISRNWDPKKTNSIFSAVLLSVVGIFLILKIAFIILRRGRNQYDQSKGAQVTDRTPILKK